MSGIAQIIQAMLSVSPQVTQMSRPRGMPSISMGSPSSGAGARFAANAARNRGAQQQAPEYGIPEPYEVQNRLPQGQPDPMQQVQPPGYQGSPLQGPPDPNQAYQQGQTPQDEIAVMERARFEAMQEIQRLQNDQSTKGRWEAREKIPGLQNQVAAINQHLATYDAQQNALQAKARGQRALQIAERMKLPNPMTIADEAAVNDEAMQELLGAYTDWEAKNNERRFMQSEETKTEQERYSAYREYGIPDPVAMQMARNEDMPVDTGVKLYWEGQEAEQENLQARFDAMETTANSLFAVDNTIKQITNTLESARGFGALGLMGALTDMIPESPAYNTVQMLDTQKAANAFRELRDMRESSKTGGALGNVSNREIELLYSAFTALNPKIGNQFISNLTDVLQRYERVKWMLKNEESSLERMKAGELTQQEFFNEATEYTNAATARHMGTPLEALEDLKQNPETIDDFKTTFGWSPISNVRQ